MDPSMPSPWSLPKVPRTLSTPGYPGYPGLSQMTMGFPAPALPGDMSPFHQPVLLGRSLSHAMTASPMIPQIPHAPSSPSGLVHSTSHLLNLQSLMPSVSHSQTSMFQPANFQFTFNAEPSTSEARQPAEPVTAPQADLAMGGTSACSASAAPCDSHALAAPSQSSVHRREAQRPALGVCQEPMNCDTQLKQCIAECRRVLEAKAAQCRSAGKKYVDPDFPSDSRSLWLNGLSPSEPLSSVTVSSWCRSKPQGEQPQVGYQGADVIAPGVLGSFYLQGALAMMRSVGKDPNELIVHRDADVGIYGVRFFKDGRWIYEILDDLLPESEQRPLSSSCNGQEWPALIEKAYAKLHGCYEAVATGAEEDAMEDLLGAGSGRFAVSDFPVWAELWQHLRSKRKRGFALAAIRRREAAGEALRLKGFEGEDDGNGLRRLQRTPRVFHRSNDIRHTKRNELRANLLPCILQVDRAPSEGACLASDAVEEHSEKYKHYKGILSGRSEGENETQVFVEKDAFPPGWDPSWQAVEACQGLRDLVQDRSLRYRRPVEEMVNVNSDLPFRHEDAPVDLEELTNSLTIEFQNLENSWKGTKQAFTSLQIASRVPLLVKDPGGMALETQSLPNDVHTLRLDLNPGEVRHIACNMKSRHFKGTALERRLVQLVDPERSALAALMRALKARETEARGHAAVLSDLLREVSVPLPALEEELRHRRGDAAGEERLQALLADSRRTLARLLAVADKLAPVAQPLAASLAHAIDRMALICVREVDRVAIRCHEEYEQLLQAFFESDVARKQAEDLIEKIGGRHASGDLASRLKVMENELQQQARTHAKLIDEKNSLEVALAEAESTGAGLRGRVRQLEEEILHLRRRQPAQPAWTSSEVKLPEQKRCPVKSDSETSLCEIESEDTFAEADRQGKKDRPRLEVAQPPPPAVFTVAGTAQTDTEFYFCKGDDFQAPEEISFDLHSSILQTVQRLYKMLGKYEWNAKTGSFLYRTDGSSSDEGMEGQRRPSMGRLSLLGNNRNADIRRLKVKVQEAHQQAAASQLKEQLERLRPVVKGSFDEWLAKLLKESGSDKLQAGRLPDPDKLYDASAGAMSADLQQRAERLRLQAAELVLRKILTSGDSEPDPCVLEAAVLEARQLPGVNAELLSAAEAKLEEANNMQQLEEKPDVLRERLFDAVNDGDLPVATRCLDANAGTSAQLSIDVTDHDGNTPLSEAACYGEVELAKFFLSRGAHPDSRNDLGRTPLWRACYNGHAEIVELLLQSGADKSIPNNLGEEPVKHGTAATKSLIESWDPLETARLKEALSLGPWQKAAQTKTKAASTTLPLASERTASPLEEMIQSGEVTWPVKIGLKELQLALIAAHDSGKVPLVIANGLEQVEQFLLYSCDGLIDGKQLISEVFIKQSATLDEARERLKESLLSTMESHGSGLSLHVRLGDSACDFTNFCAPNLFPAEVFGGPARWNDEEVHRHFPDPMVCFQPEFRLVVSSRFTITEAHEHLADKLPYFQAAACGMLDFWQLSEKCLASRSWKSHKAKAAGLKSQSHLPKSELRLWEDSLNRLIPVADRLRQNEGDGSFWKRVMRSVKHSMTARRGSSAMRAEAVQRLNSGAKLSQINTLARLHGELALIWQTMPPKPQKLAAGTLLLRPLAPQVLQEAVRNYYLKSCNRHKQVEQAVFNLCRAVLQFAASYKVLLFAVMCDVLQPTELGGRLPIVAPEARSYLPSLEVSSLANLPFDAVHTMNEFMTALKNMRRSRTFHGAGDGSFERVSKDGGGDAGPEVEREDVLLPLPLVLAAAEVVCGRSKLTAEYFNVMLMGYSRQPRLLPRLDEEAEPSPSESPVEGSSELRSASRNSESSLASSETGGEESDSKVPTKALLVSHLLAADRMRRHPEMWEETDYFVDSLWEAVMKRVNPTKVSHFSVLSNRVELAEATVAAQVTIERFRLQVPEALVASALKEVQPGGAPFDSERRQKEGYVTKEAVEVIMHLWRQCGGAASVCCTESHALWAVLWALALERGYEVQLMGRFFDIFDESGDGSLQYDEFVNFMAHIAPAVPEADCASFFMAVAEDTSADMTQEVFINLVQRVGVSSDLDGLKSLVEARAKA
ncbi:ADL1 [Symbiodinium sp. CCMP2456]|nr:ADL1 [Symbiodinium sp. CCMP2456]